ncbi:hypothetical protein BDN67DRAFT_897622 [Paxillus ammoniavirescens]|nr:hypothetical protein BDN67DRAFT_897622 [Paxillus ammoniavirescens]
MATLRPPSSPSPSPLNAENGRSSNSARASMGPRQTLASPRPPGGGSGARPTSELLGSASMFQTPESEAIDQWFENLQNYEETLEDMAAASLDVNFKEELSAIEQWFKVLSEAERTAALYSLLQQSTQVQIRFFITVLQQMARSDPMTALLSPAVGGSMQSQMEAKLAQMTLKSPSMKSPMPSSPRVFSGSQNRQSLALDTTSSGFLSPDSAALGSNHDAAATLAQQRAKLKASNAAHRISAPILSTGSGDTRTSWGSALSQVAEQNLNLQAQEIVLPSPNGARPKSTEFSGSLGTPRVGVDALSPMVGDSWASNVNTPLIPMFGKDAQSTQNLDAAAAKLSDWNNAGPRVPLMADPKSFRRASKGNTSTGTASDTGNHNNNVYDNDGNLVQPQQAGQRKIPMHGTSNNNAQFPTTQQSQWNGARSPALPTPSRFGEESNAPLSGLGMGSFNMAGLNSPGLGMGMPSAGLLAGMNPLQMNMLNLQAQMNAMGMTPEAQILAAQMAAGFTPQSWLSLQQAAIQGNNSNNNRGRGGGRSPGLPKTGSSSGNNAGGGGSGAKKDDDDVDPALLNDIPAWLRSLRLHKYTPNFEKMKWQDMIILDDAGLEAKGVAALGARRKMMKTFEAVRKKLGIETPPGYNHGDGLNDG